MKHAILLTVLSTALLRLPAFGQAQESEPAGASASAAQTAPAKRITLESSDFTTKANEQIAIIALARVTW